MSREWEKAYHWFSREAVPAFGLTPPQIAVYNALRDRADNDGETFPSQETIGRESGIGPRAVRAAVARLVDLGLVEIVRRGRRGGIRYRIGMRPALPETGSRIRNGEAETGSRIRNEPSQTGSRIRSKPDRGSDEEDPVKKTQAFGAPPQADDGPGSPTPGTSPADAFEAWYAAYPVDRNKPAARKEWTKTRAEHPADLLARTKQFARSVQGKDLQFVKHPTTWLRDRMWESVSLPTISPDQRAREIWERHGRPEEGTPGWDAFVAERDDERRAS